MYLGFPNRSDCDRARELASRGLDGDLTEFDASALRTHLRECVACAEVAQAMGEITEQVRTAVPMEPAPPVVVAVRPVRRGRHRLAATAVAIVATAAAAGAGAVVASHSHQTSAGTRPATTLAELAPLDHQFRSIHEGKLLLVLPAPRVRSPHARSFLV